MAATGFWMVFQEEQRSDYDLSKQYLHWLPGVMGMSHPDAI